MLAHGRRPGDIPGTASTTRPRSRALLKSLLLFSALLYLVLNGAAWLLADRLIFLPPSSSYSESGLPVRMVPAEDGARIATLHLPNPTSPYTILYSHGNAEDLGHVLPILEEIRRSGFSVVAYDYRGYGASSGSAPSARGSYRDIEAVYRHATTTLAIDPRRIVLYGRSVGSGPATHLAATEPVAGLVIESGFTSAFRVVTGVPLLAFDRFPNERNLRRVRVPVLVIHGTEDEVIPVSHGLRLYAAAAGPKRSLWVEGAQHNDVTLAEAGVRALREFVTMLDEPPPATATDPRSPPPERS